jgi:branched-chain amino acid transport system permease protein
VSFATFIQLVFDGLAIGLVYVFMAAGFNLILSVTNMFFVAFGIFYALGAYITWALVQVGLPFFASVVISSLAAAAGGAIVHLLVMRKVNAGEQALPKALITSIMLYTVLFQLVLLAVGTSPRGLPPVFEGSWKIGGVIIGVYRAVMILISVVVLVSLHFFLQRSRVGRGARALAINRDVAALHGVNAAWMATTIFAVGLGLAGFAGGIMAPLFGISITMGQTGFVVLLVIMLGGIGSMLGSILAGIILGLILSFSQFFLSAGVGQMVFFGIVAFFFYFRPGGIFGKPMEDPPGEVGYLTHIRLRLTGPWKWVAVVVGLAIVLVLPIVVNNSYYVHLLILTLSYAVLGMTLTLGMRAGMINVAGAAFWGIGAYSTALFMGKAGMNFWASLPITLAITLVLSLLLGAVVCRFAGTLGMMFSIVFASLIPVVFQTFRFFGQAAGLSAIPPVSDLGPIHFSSVDSYYYLLLAFSAVAVVVMLAFNRAWTGRGWLALASSSKLAQSVGVNPFTYRLINFVLMSMIPALLGTVYACYMNSVQPSTFGVFAGVDFLVIAFLGGLSYLVVGPIVGALIVVLLPELLRVTGNAEPIITAVIIILIVMYFPRGVLGSIDRSPWRRWRRAVQPATIPDANPPVIREEAP